MIAAALVLLDALRERAEKAYRRGQGYVVLDAKELVGLLDMLDPRSAAPVMTTARLRSFPEEKRAGGQQGGL